MNIKTILSLGALAATGALVFGKNKFGEYKTVLDQLQFKLDKVKNVKFNQTISFDVDVKITNPTPTAIDIPGNKLILKTLHFYSKSGRKLGIAYPNISDIELPANGFREITNIPVQLSLSEIGNNLSEILDVVSNKDNLRIVVDIEAFGKQFTVNA